MQLTNHEAKEIALVLQCLEHVRAYGGEMEVSREGRMIARVSPSGIDWCGF